MPRRTAATADAPPVICWDATGATFGAHWWIIPPTPYADFIAGVETQWAVDDPRRDWTCARCDAHKPSDEALRRARSVGTWPAAKLHKAKAQALKDAALRAEAAG